MAHLRMASRWTAISSREELATIDVPLMVAKAATILSSASAMAACTPPMEETGAGGGATGVGLGAEDGATSAGGWGEMGSGAWGSGAWGSGAWGRTGRTGSGAWGRIGSGAWGGIGRTGWAAGVVPNRTRREKIKF